MSLSYLIHFAKNKKKIRGKLTNCYQTSNYLLFLFCMLLLRILVKAVTGIVPIYVEEMFISKNLELWTHLLQI